MSFCFYWKDTPLVKFIPNYNRDAICVFVISSLVKISMISLISSLQFNSLVYDQTSSSLPRKSSAIFGNQVSENLQILLTFGQVLENLLRSSEVVGNLRKIVNNAVISMSGQQYIDLGRPKRVASGLGCSKLD